MEAAPVGGCRHPDHPALAHSQAPAAQAVLAPPHHVGARKFAQRTQSVWDTFYGLKSIWMRSRFIKSMRARLAFVLISKIYRQMYADTGIATDSARVSRSAQWARWLAKPCQKLFAASPMPDLEIPGDVGRNCRAGAEHFCQRLSGPSGLHSHFAAFASLIFASFGLKGLTSQATVQQVLDRQRLSGQSGLRSHFVCGLCGLSSLRALRSMGLTSEATVQRS